MSSFFSLIIVLLLQFSSIAAVAADVSFPIELKKFQSQDSTVSGKDLYFRNDLSNVRRMTTKGKSGILIDSYAISFNDETEKLDFSEIRLSDRNIARIYEFNTGISVVWAIELRGRNRRKFLSLSNISDYAFSSDKKLLAVYGKFPDPAGIIHRETKIIDLQRKTVVTLPRLPCMADVRWSENKLITSSYVEEDYNDSVADFCAWERDGSLINSFTLHGAVLGGDHSPPGNVYGFLPLVPHGFYVMVRNKADTVMDGVNYAKCDLVAIDLDNPEKTVTKTFDALVLKETPTKEGMDHYHCAFFNDDKIFDINLDSFTFDNPAFSFKNTMYDSDDRTIYRYSNWHIVK